MKKTPLSIRIEKPCHEDWDQMTPTDRGKFCGSCQKNVTDFSTMTDNEILQFLNEHTGSLCGQLRGSQLNRAIVNTRLSAQSYHLNTIFAALMVAGGAGAMSAQTAPPPYNPTVIIDEKHPAGPVCIKTTPEAKKHILSAVVVDTISGDRLAFATVTMAGTTCSAQTDEHGKFVMEIPDSLFTETITFQVHASGYFRETVTIASKDIAATKKLEVALNEIMMKGEMIIEEPRKPVK